MLTFDIYKKKKNKIRQVELIIRVIVSFSETRYSRWNVLKIHFELKQSFELESRVKNAT